MRVTGTVMVFAPAPQLTVSIEPRGAAPDIHLHAGGQGVWQARMLRSLGVPVVMCAVFGGETGRVVRHLIIEEGVEIRAVDGRSSNGTYISDRRGPSRVIVAEAGGEALSRHELGQLYGLALSEGLRAGTSLLSGPTVPNVIAPDVYRRLASDLTRNGCQVLADLSGEHLTASLAGNPALVKVSHEELLRDGRVNRDALDDIIDAMCDLRAAGAGTVVVTRAHRPALALIEDEVWEVVTPRFETAEPRGAGDSLTAGVAAGLARGESIVEAIRTGAAAGAINVTRHGLGTGQPEAVAELRERIHLEAVRAAATSAAGREGTHLQTTPEQLAARIRRQ